MLLDSDYVLIGLPAFSLAVWAQWRLVSACRTAGRIASSSGLTGAEVSHRLMGSCSVNSVDVETTSGQLADYYVPSGKVLRLSAGVASGRSLAAVGVAAHEAGHALQHHARSPFLFIRSLIVPLANLCATTFWLLVLAGLVLGMFRLIIWSVFLLWCSVIAQLINLPIELDAGRRARKALVAEKLLTPEEEAIVDHVLSSAAWTHVAGVLTDIWPLRQLLSSTGWPVSSGHGGESP
ncbi:MAG: zinc metallopeptidase [Isosphaeraceae bacterium]